MSHNSYGAQQCTASLLAITLEIGKYRTTTRGSLLHTHEYSSYGVQY